MQTPKLGEKVFRTAPLSLFQWAVCILAGIGSLVCYQLVLFVPLWGAKEEKTAAKEGRQRNMSDQVEKVGQPLLNLRSSGRKTNLSIGGRNSSVAVSYSAKEESVKEVKRSAV